MRICLYLAFLCVLSIGCSRRWCDTHFPPSVDSVYKVITKDSIIYRDTTIFIHLPGEVVIDSVVIPCPDPGPAYIPKKVCAETSLASACAWFSWPVIKIELVQKDTTIQKRLDNALKESYFWKSEYERINVTPQPQRYVPGFFKFCTFAFIGIVLAALGYITFRVFLKR